MHDNERLLVRGGRKLSGDINVSGAKNSALICIAAACLVNDGSEVRLSNVPNLSDISAMVDILRYIGKTVEVSGDTITISGTITRSDVPSEMASRMRGSIYFMGLLLGVTGQFSCGLPGGDKIGPRPIDMHIAAFETLGAKVEEKTGRCEATTEGPLTGKSIYLKFPSVGTVCNIMLAAALADGKTTIGNAAREPEIVDVANLMIKMGIKVVGAGTDRITIEGSRDKIHGDVDHEIIYDRIETGVFLSAVAMTGGEVFVRNGVARHNYPLLAILGGNGVEVKEEVDGIWLKSSGQLKEMNVSMMPFPGVATDLQPIIATMATRCSGNSTITDYVFPERFQYLYELIRMGARIEHYQNVIKIQGGTQLFGAEVEGNDIRATSALVCAGLIAEGETRVTGIKHLLRGYIGFEDRLVALGADIKRIPE